VSQQVLVGWHGGLAGWLGGEGNSREVPSIPGPGEPSYGGCLRAHSDPSYACRVAFVLVILLLVHRLLVSVW
jgi:hypothetical protein